MQIIVYAVSLWLGLYLLARDPSNPRLRNSGLGLISYALALAFDLAASYAPNPTSVILLNRLHWGILFFPPIFWTGAVIHLHPEIAPNRTKLQKIWRWGIFPLGCVAFLLVIITNTFWSPETGHFLPWGYGLFALTNLFPLIATVCLIRFVRKELQPRQATGALIAATLFFTLGAGLITLQLGWLPHLWIVIAIGLDLELLGLAIVWFDAYNEGEALLPDFLRSLVISTLAALIFAGQVAVVIALQTGMTLPMVLLLLTSIAAALAVTTFSTFVQGGIDRFVFKRNPRVRESRSDLRAAAIAAPRVDQTLKLDELSEDEFARLTRRALSHFSDLPRLAASPLTRLPIISARLRSRSAQDNTLERAAELKTVLTESISRLKPQVQETFGTTDEWRFYNALYFPYIAGLRPYSRRGFQENLDENLSDALRWFQATVPERTLYNWQNAASKLVAQDLRERSIPEKN
ncbi:MAG: hypothetical protein ISR58_00720 [Anaerolineales bacterium]|nr:hypothetical protein [Chloroflexota bacterium]MBL6979686.1 hypothetical protein [Anaerolineales bacterium]